MRTMVVVGLVCGLAVLSRGGSPTVVAGQHTSGGISFGTPMVRQGQSTTFGNFGGGIQRSATSQKSFGGGIYSGGLRSYPSHPSRDKGVFHQGKSCSPGYIVLPGYSYYGGGYYYGSSAARDLADAEWAKVRLMEEELRLKEEQLKLEYEAKLAELEVKQQQILREDRKSSWDRAVAMYPPLLDPKSKMRVWYEHLLKQAREDTDRWGQPIRVPELDAPDYPEVFAHRAAQQIGLKPLPLPPPQTTQAEAVPDAPAQTVTASDAPISVGEEIPD